MSFSVKVNPSSGKAKPVVFIVIEFEAASTLLTVNSRPLIAAAARAFPPEKSPAMRIFSFIEIKLVPPEANWTVRVFSVELKTIVLLLC